MVAVLRYHVGQHAAGLLAVGVTAQSAPAPGDFFPDEEAQLVAQAQDDVRLLVVSQADEVGAQGFYLLHFALHQLLGQGGAPSGVVFVAVRAAKQQAPAIEVERPVLLEAEVPEAEACGGLHGVRPAGQAHAAGER